MPTQPEAVTERKPRWGLRLLFASVVLVVYVLLTGGLAFSSRSDFGGQGNVKLVDGIKCDLWLSPEYKKWSFPLIFHFSRISGPYGLRIQIWDSGRTFASIVVSETVLTYQDGTTERIGEEWKRALTPYTQTNSSSSGIVTTEMMMLSDTMENLVKRHQNLTITLRGHLLKKDGSVVPFDTTEDFRAETDFHIATWWQVLSGV